MVGKVATRYFDLHQHRREKMASAFNPGPALIGVKEYTDQGVKFTTKIRNTGWR
jgi:hypothetical protein